MWRVKNAARPCRVLKAATTTSTSVAYPTPVHRVKHPAKNFRRDRRPPIPSALTAAGLSLLCVCLALQDGLVATDRQSAVALAKHCATEIVEAAQAEGMV